MLYLSEGKRQIVVENRKPLYKIRKKFLNNPLFLLDSIDLYRTIIYIK